MKIENDKIKNIWVRKGTSNFGNFSKPLISAVGIQEKYNFEGDGTDVNITFNNRGGYATSWTISPNVSNSLTFDKTSGKIGGNSQGFSGNNYLTFTVTAKNGYGTSSVNVTLLSTTWNK